MFIQGLECCFSFFLSFLFLFFLLKLTTNPTTAPVAAPVAEKVFPLFWINNSRTIHVNIDVAAEIWVFANAILMGKITEKQMNKGYCFILMMFKFISLCFYLLSYSCLFACVCFLPCDSWCSSCQSRSSVESEPSEPD